MIVVNRRFDTTLTKGVVYLLIKYDYNIYVGNKYECCWIYKEKSVLCHMQREYGGWKLSAEIKEKI